jgi:hypothetical protein
MPVASVLNCKIDRHILSLKPNCISSAMSDSYLPKDFLWGFATARFVSATLSRLQPYLLTAP